MHGNRFAVFGHPVAHSLSPQIHAAFAAQSGIALEYLRIDATPDRFAAALITFARDGGRGANVTVPHKLAAAALSTALSERAHRAGAVNTLLRDGDGWRGDNTDGIGLVRDLRDRHGVALAGARVWLFGAGGAAAGVAPALLDAGVARLHIVNRSRDNATRAAARLDDPRVTVAALGDAPGRAAGDALAMFGDARETFDLAINATSAARGPYPVDWSLPRRRSANFAAVDLGYGAAAQAFLDFAREAGVSQRIDGLGMLVEQAAESFRLWHGVLPDTAPVLAEMREALAAG